MLAAMSTSTLRTLAVIVIALVPAHALAWPTIVPEGPRTPLLGGRWTVVLGAEASSAPAQSERGVLAPPIALDGLTAIEVDEGHLAVRATLLFATGPADLLAVVRALPAPCAAPTIGPFPGHEGVVAIRCASPSPDGSFRPLVLYATHTDGWVDRLEVQLEIDDAADQASAIAFVDAALGSLRAEDVPPAVERGTVEVARLCASGEALDSLTIALPEEWIATKQENADLTLVQLVRASELGAPRAIASITLSRTSGAPARIPAGAGTEHAGSVLGQDVRWLEIVGESEAPGIRELALALSVACGGEAPPWTATVQLAAGGPSGILDEGTRVLERVAFASDRGHTLTATPIGTEEAEPAPDVAGGDSSADDEAAAATSHAWSMGIGAVSLALLVLALALRARTSRPSTSTKPPSTEPSNTKPPS